jgi:ABC-type branched-subunit amino acid transport system permease subunit
MTERRAITGSWIAAIAISVAFFFAADAYALRLGTLLATYVALASGWNIIGGMAGYPSFATAAFFGLGAYAGALVQQKGVPMPLAWSFGARWCRRWRRWQSAGWCCACAAIISRSRASPSPSCCAS